MTAEADKATLYNRPIEAPRANIFLLPPMIGQLRDHVFDAAIPRGDLRRGQVEALQETVSFLEGGGRVGYVEQVSGYGKSRWMQEISDGFGGRQVFITPGETATTNIVGKLGEGVVGRIDKDHKEFGFNKTVVTMQSLNRIWTGIERGDRGALDQGALLFGADIVFADEIHHYLTPKALKILSAFLQMNPQSVMLGATATEGYNSEKNAEKLFGKCLHRVDLQEGVEEGVLISPHVQLVRTGLSLDGLKLSPEGNFVFNDSVPVVERDEKLLDAYLRASGKEGKLLRMISFLSNVRHAYQFAEQARQRGIPIEVVTGETKNREAIYGKLEEGRIRIVATVDTAIESLDLPWLEGTLHSAQTRSMRVARQAFPRSMRNIEGKKPPWIIQVVDEATSAKRRPIIVPDILGVAKFMNGAVVVPRKVDEGQDGKEGIIARKEREEIVLPQDVEVDIEVIDINSLFKMGFLDRIRILRQGLLEDDDVEKLRIDLVGALWQYGDLSKIPAENLISYYFVDPSGDEVSVVSIVCAIRGTTMEGVTPSHMRELKEFLLKNRHLEIRTRGDTKNFTEDQVSFRELCQRYRNGDLTEEELAELRIAIGDILSVVASGNTITLEELDGYSIDHPKFRGNVPTLTYWLGLTKRHRIDAGARNKLFRLVDDDGGGSFESDEFGDPNILDNSRSVEDDTTEKLELDRDIDIGGQVIPEMLPEIDDTRAFLRRELEHASRMGLDMHTVAGVQGYHIYAPQFEGNLITFIGRLLGKKNREIKKADIQRVLDFAGF